MRRPILLFLFAQIGIIVFLYNFKPFGLSDMFDCRSELLSKNGKIVTVDGTVTNVQIKEYYTALYVHTGKETVFIRLSGIDDEQQLYGLNGRKVSITGKVSLPSKIKNPNCFDYSLYLKGRGISTIIDVSKYRISAGPVTRPISHILYVLKGRFYARIKPLMSADEFSVLAGLMFGDKSYMDDELYENYQNTGIAHILAVSGLHVSLVYTIIEKLAKGHKNKKAAFLTVFLLYCYASLSGFAISVIRASLMIVIRIIAFHMHKPYDRICAASISASILLAVNPFILFDTGFILSFAAAFTISSALPFIKSKFTLFSIKKRNKRLLDAGNVFVSGFAINLGMAPLIAYFFLNYSLISLIINPLAIALSGLILPAGMIGFLCSFIFSGLPLALSISPASAFIKLLSLINGTAEKLNLSGSCKAPPIHALFFYYIFFFWFFSETRIVLNRKHKQKPLFCIALGIMIFGIIMPKGYENHIVTFVDVGQGDCIHINYKGCNILIDGGGSYFKNIGKDTLKEYLLKNGIDRIDYAVATHKDLDHSRGLEELCECFDVEHLIYAGENNDDCAIIGFNTNGVSFLFMSDATKAREEKLIKLNPDLHADILKVGHHGSSTSTSSSFISVLHPSFAVISCGLNNKYNHPSADVVELIEKSSIIYGRTDYCGAIYLEEIKNNTIIFENAAKDTKWHITIQK